MQYILLSILAIPFLYFNYKIIKSDIKDKKIPNKYLLYLIFLVPFYYLYLFIFGVHIDIFKFIFQIISTFLISFSLYYYGVWSAGDAKYLLVLALFLPIIGIIPFIGNIALLTIRYLLGYFIWFYLGKCLFNRKYAKNLYLNIYNDLKEKWIINKKNKGGKTLYILLKGFFIFIIIFVSIKLFKIYIISNFIIENQKNNYLTHIFIYYSNYIILISIILFVGLLYMIKKISYIFKNFIINKLEINYKKVNYLFIIIINLFLFIFLIYEYKANTELLIHNLYTIFTRLLIIYLIIKILIHLYRISFDVGETYYKNFLELNENDEIDMKNIKTIFKDKSSLLNKYDLNLNDLDLKDKVQLEKLITIIRVSNETKNTFETDIKYIKIVKTFSFGIYIFIGFIITIILGNSIVNQLVSILIDYLK
ncbi:MAG: hypothetical protein PHG82_01470 [Candidatus Gracilibacteria bacterium]|nr:hypothetical protein [Candidatus Gracilibacteria bacterium]